MPCRMSLDSWRVMILPSSVTMKALLEVPSVMKPSSTSQASSAPMSFAVCFARDEASNCTVLMSRRCQRMSGRVTTARPLAAVGLFRMFFSWVNMTSDGVASLGKLKSRSAAPRVICM